MIGREIREHAHVCMYKLPVGAHMYACMIMYVCARKIAIQTCVYYGVRLCLECSVDETDFLPSNRADKICITGEVVRPCLIAGQT